MVPSERAIEQAIESLDPTSFQQLAEAYLAIEYPNRFARQMILGRNSRGATTAGWPDAYVVMSDGRIDALEATADTANWTRHLDSDLRKAAALSGSGLGGFAFVTSARTPRPATLTSRQEQLSKLGVDSARQTFVFRQTLVSDLCSGRFAQIWASILKLPVSSHPFSGLRNAPIYGTGASSQFMPTESEYEEGRVTQPSVLKKVDGRLKDVGFVLVKGRGASGKTALAASVGWQRLVEDRPVYYLDLADPYAGGPDFVRAAAETVITRGDRGVLFIVDNVHQNETTAKELHLSWNSSDNESELLFLSRRAESPETARGIKPPLLDLSAAAIELRVGRGMLCGVFNRLRKRQGKPPVEVPPAVQKRWLKLFGGDLIAFGAALVQAEVGPPDWALSPADARHYLYQRYLDGLDPQGQRDLCTVADRSALELSTPESLIALGSLGPALVSGILERRSGEIRTVHPGIGELIVAAAGASVGDFASEVDARERPSGSAAVTAQRLFRRGRVEAAAMQIRRLHALGTPAFEIVGGLGSGSMRERVRILQILLGPERVVQLLGSKEEISRFVVTGPLWELLAFRWVARSLGRSVQRRLLTVFKRELSQGAIDIERLATEACETPKNLPMTIRQVRRLSPELYEALLPLLVRDDAFATCVRTVPGFQKRRWADLLEAACTSDAVAKSIAEVLLKDPESAVEILLYKGRGLDRVIASSQVPIIERALISSIRSSTYHRVVKAALLTYGTRRFSCAIELTARFDSQFLAELDSLSEQRDQIAARARAWRSAPKARRRMLAVTREHCPQLHAALLSDIADQISAAA